MLLSVDIHSINLMSSAIKRSPVWPIACFHRTDWLPLHGTGDIGQNRVTCEGGVSTAKQIDICLQSGIFFFIFRVAIIYHVGKPGQLLGCLNLIWAGIAVSGRFVHIYKKTVFQSFAYRLPAFRRCQFRNIQYRIVTVLHISPGKTC